MTQLSSLYAFIEESLPGRLMETTGADCWMDDIQLLRTSKSLGLGQQLIGERRYSGVLGWERWPYRDYDPDILFALVNVWLDESGSERRHYLGLDDPDVDIEIRDNQTAIIIISVPLVDEIAMVPDEDGPIPCRGKRYRLAEPSVWFAQSVQVRTETSGGDGES